MKRTRQSERIEREAREKLPDRLSDLPDCVLLHIMKFMNAKHAVQTCVLSKRWKDLWKRLTNLTLHSLDFSSLPFFSKFVSSVLSCRDDSISLHNLDLWRFGCIEPKLLNGVMTYAASHDVQQLMIKVRLNLKHDFELPPCIFYCRSLTFLKLSFWFPCPTTKKIKLPKSLELPALKSLHLEHVTFTTSDNGCVEPFSTCNMLNTLVIRRCSLQHLQHDANICISNAKLSNLTIISHYGWENVYKITLSTPNLSLLTIKGEPIHKFSAGNLSFLEEVNIDVSSFFYFPKNDSIVISWLQVIASVKIMTLSSGTLQMLNGLLSSGSLRSQPPSFVRLKSLKLKMESFLNISDDGVSKIVKYLLQNSPPAGVDVINC